MLLLSGVGQHPCDKREVTQPGILAYCISILLYAGHLALVYICLPYGVVLSLCSVAITEHTYGILYKEDMRVCCSGDQAL